MNNLEASLTLEQEFNHRAFCDRVEELDLQQTRELLKQLHKQMLYKDNIYKELILAQEKDIVDTLFGVRQ